MLSVGGEGVSYVG